MCIVFSGFRMWVILFCYLLAQAKTYPLQEYPLYSQVPREYPDDDYYYAPKVQYYYDAPAINVPEVYGQVPYSYFYDPYGHFSNEEPKRQEERLAALPIGQETWFESESSPRWRSNNIDDVNAAFLDNLILTQMAQDAQRRRENARAAFSNIDYEEKDKEDEDVRELKALAGKPLYHVPKTVPIIEEDDYADDDADSFINWNGNKRSVSTTTPEPSTEQPKDGQKEVVMPRPAPIKHVFQSHQSSQDKKTSPFYNTIKQLLEKQGHDTSKSRRIDKRYVAGDSDLVVELRGLKHRIAT
ncbi:uncharacterized protein LOC120627370 [Pararge aegeria]|uniref:Jg4351 protein n=1 Tax=Pararge aegeria aegeria TaxID=348720 RepID=A0A8S4RN48_9NEOP|nr:uncharacterized protein LOC120627370 [Pararge aegeria]CAH2238677.1 jg4351 [Pararge aegeria aegeria]